jgi:hypothetical protein
MGVEQEKPVATVHHGETELDEADRAIAQIMTFPAAPGHGAGAEERGGNLAVARALEPPVERAQGEDEPVSASLRQRGGIGTGVAAGQAAPEPDRSGRADVEQLVERQENSRRFGTGFVDMYAKHGAVTFDEASGALGRQHSVEGQWRKPKSWISEVSRELCQSDHARQGMWRPEDRFRILDLGAADEIVTPSAG